MHSLAVFEPSTVQAEAIATQFNGQTHCGHRIIVYSEYTSCNFSNYLLVTGSFLCSSYSFNWSKSSCLYGSGSL